MKAFHRHFGIGIGIGLALSSAVLQAADAPTPTPRTLLSGPSENAPRQPQIAIGENGRVVLVYGQGTTIHCMVSKDGGAHFDAPTTVAKLPAIALGMRRGPRVAITGRDQIIVSAIDGGGYKTNNGDVLSWHSRDNGQSWSGPTRINTVATSAREGLHALAGGPDGTAFATWLDLRADRTELWGAVSKDGGATWQADHRVYASPDRSICECCHPSAAVAPDGTIYVMWRNQINGDRDIFLARSRDKGKTFENAAKLGTGTWKLDHCPMDGGAIALGRDGEPVTAWRRDQSVFQSESGRPETLLGEGYQPWVAVGRDGPQFVWLAGAASHKAARPLIWQTVSKRASVPITLAPAATAPVIAAGPNGMGPVVAAWETPGPEPSIQAVVLAP